MSVFTPLTVEQVAHWLKRYSLGSLERLDGVAEGVQNSNFFLDTAYGRYVLTVFEQFGRDELPFFVNLMAHLSRHGIPCPAPIANRDNEYIGELAGKPALIVTRLHGNSPLTPSTAQCAALGALLADTHLAAQSCGIRQNHPRGAGWRRDAAAQIAPLLPAADAVLLRDEIRFEAQQRRGDLPRGIIHADLFRDNVLFDGDRVSGLLDFYFAGVDDLLFDLAVTANDWCRASDAGGGFTDELDAPRTQALLGAYHAVRPLNERERAAWPALLRAAALRFWLSRLIDQHRPRSGELVVNRDPDEYRALLCRHIAADGRQPWIDAHLA